MISQEDGQNLIKLARQSIEFGFLNKEVIPSKPLQTKFSKQQGVFVTLTENGVLRGCIGFPEPVLPLIDAVIKAGSAAAFEDPRFPPLGKSELDKVHIEMSVLTVPELIKVNSPEEYLNKIKIGEDGLIIRGHRGSGLLLPQVFTEYSCTVEQALEMTCQKAGLGKSAWKDTSNRIYKFQAQIFEENSIA
jgi:uncharacterized protein